MFVVLVHTSYSFIMFLFYSGIKYVQAYTSLNLM